MLSRVLVCKILTPDFLACETTTAISLATAACRMCFDAPVSIIYHNCEIIISIVCDYTETQC